jgi:hypothetical protein
MKNFTTEVTEFTEKSYFSSVVSVFSVVDLFFVEHDARRMS